MMNREKLMAENVHKYNADMSAFVALFSSFQFCEQHGLGVGAMSSLMKLIGSIMGDQVRPKWWPKSSDQVEALLEFPDFKKESHDVHHFCPVCEKRFPFLEPCQYKGEARQICDRDRCNGKRFRAEGMVVVPTQLAYYKKPHLIFQRFAQSPELMEALKQERLKREEKMKMCHEWEDWFHGKCQVLW